MTPFFSVIIPVFNQENIFTDCLSSIISQSFGDYEVIIVNDGSTDASSARISDFIKGDERFRIIEHDANSSVLCARITGLSAARGKYIVFIDIDDYVEPDYFEKAAAALSENPVDILSIGVTMEPSGKKMLPPKSPDRLRNLLECKGISALFIDIFKKSVVDETLLHLKKGYCNMAEDFYIKTVAYNYAKSFGYLDEYLYHYVTTGGMCNNTKDLNCEKLKKQLSHIELAITYMKDFLLENNKDLVPLIDNTAFSIITSTMYQYGGRDSSWKSIYEYMSIFNCDKYEAVFNWMFEEFIPLRVSLLKKKA